MGKNDTIFDKIMFASIQGEYIKVRHNTTVLQWVESQPTLQSTKELGETMLFLANHTHYTVKDKIVPVPIPI